MNNSQQEPSMDDSLKRANLIDAACDEFEAAWRNQQIPRIEDFLGDTHGPGRETLFSELLKVELNYRLRCGDRVDPAEYCERFPQFKNILLDSALTRVETTNVQPLQPTELDGLILEQQIGSGSFGDVWQAWDLELQRSVAVKVPRAALVSRVVDRLFLREARAAACLHHPGIVKIYRVGQSRIGTYLVSQLIQGTTLKEWMATTRIAPRLAAEICRQIAESLQHAHEHGIIHRDLKPGNVLVDQSGNTYLTDFGLAKQKDATESLAPVGEVIGTIAYMSPEQANGHSDQIDARSDLYSLGILFFELLTGRTPFEGSPKQILQQVLNAEPVSPCRLVQSLPKDLERICLKAIARDPRDRYASGAEFSADLLRFLNGRPVHARPLSSLRKVLRSVFKHPAISGMAFTIIVLASLLGATIWKISDLQSQLESVSPEIADR